MLSQLQEHDLESLLLETSGGRTSHRYMGESERKHIRNELTRVRPFDLSREKINHFDKSSGSVYGGLSLERLEKFIDRNRLNFRKSYHHKNRIRGFDI